jgi:hypothetical protein
MEFFKVDTNAGGSQRKAVVNKATVANIKAARPAKAKSAMHALVGIPNEAEFARF